MALDSRRIIRIVNHTDVRGIPPLASPQSGSGVAALVVDPDDHAAATEEHHLGVA